MEGKEAGAGSVASSFQKCNCEEEGVRQQSATGNGGGVGWKIRELLFRFVALNISKIEKA